eukprot:TRINITY_DN32821_c0_g1_i1.p1 TRINITY_DN32821_c0_g1~~TRINITY_DN32821_c0_g1_i1.p1  ORF type:complete len:768 (+),score=85.92 TRINITY_DN32821_c0_g1_i1:74-2377(+)
MAAASASVQIWLANNTTILVTSDSDPGSGSDATTRLFNTLLVTFLAVFLGFAALRLKRIEPAKGDMKGFGFFIGEIVFPLLIFKTVATARLGDVDFSVLLACTLGKLCATSITWITTFVFYRREDPAGQRFLTATVFASYVICGNDFAIGFPVVKALYGKENMGVYIAGNALVGSLLFVPLLMVFFVIGTAMANNDAPSEEDGARTTSTPRMLFSVVRDIVKNPVIFMTLVGLAYKAALGFTLVDDGQNLNFPSPLSDALDLITGPFGMCALFLTGTTLKSLVVQKTGLVLVIMKLIVSPFLTYFFAINLTKTPDLRSFSFLYGQLPTSSAPLVFAQSFAPGFMEMLGSGIYLGLVFVGPLMYTTAMFLQDMTAESPLCLHHVIEVLGKTHYTSAAVGTAFCIAFFILLVILGRDWGWGSRFKTIVASYFVARSIYEFMMLAVSPQIHPGFCLDFNKHDGRTPAAALLTWFQNISQLLVFGMMLLLPQAKQPAADIFRNEMRTILSCIGLALIPAWTNVPSTVNEMCADVSMMARQDLTPNIIWTFVLFAVALGVSAYVSLNANAWKESEPQMELSDVNEAARSSSASLTAPAEPANQASESSSSLADPVSAWKESVPDGIIRGVLSVQLLQLLMQCVNTFAVSLGATIQGVVAEILILEHSVTLLNPVLTMAFLIADRKFTAMFLEVWPNKMACFSRDGLVDGQDNATPEVATTHERQISTFVADGGGVVSTETLLEIRRSFSTEPQRQSAASGRVLSSVNARSSV